MNRATIIAALMPILAFICDGSMISGVAENTCVAQDANGDEPPMGAVPQGADNGSTEATTKSADTTRNISSLRIYFGQAPNAMAPADNQTLDAPLKLEIVSALPEPPAGHRGRQFFADGDIKTGKAWNEATSKGKEVTLLRGIPEPETGKLELVVHAESDHRLWDNRLLVIGRTLFGDEWVLASRGTDPREETPFRIRLSRAAAKEFPPRTASNLDRLLVKLHDYKGPKQMTMEVRLIGSSFEDTAIVTRKHVDKAWQWCVLEHEGLTLSLGAEGKSFNPRVIPETSTEKFELVVYPGRPTQKTEDRIERISLQVTGYAEDDVQSYLCVASVGTGIL